MTETFYPPLAPSADSGKKVAVRIKRSDFGDGYTQRSKDGLNTIDKKYTFNWNVLTPAQVDEIEAFFEARGGYEAFFYTPPRESVPVKFICIEWSRGYSNGEADSVSATFEKVFDI